MVAHFIDVGQSDATLLEFPCGAILIDAGAQDDQHVERLLAYLDAFFDRRTDLERTIDCLFVTHPHIDHTRALREIVEAEEDDGGRQFVVARYIDSALREGMGGGDIRWVVDEAPADLRPQIITVTDADVVAAGDRTGLHSADIDPVSCNDCDPIITILSSALAEDPGWPAGEMNNANNHSLVIRVDFGGSSFLFTGDLEEHAIATLVEHYDGTALLDTDVYQVGHHGSHNGTTDELLVAMSPHIAVISMGRWDDGKRADGTARPFTTFAYGHPRRAVLDELTHAIPGYRSRALSVMTAEGARRYEEYTVRKRIYATGWEGTVKVRATLDRRFRTTTEDIP